MVEIIKKIMGKFGYRKQQAPHVLTEEDQRRSIETRRLQAQVRNLEKQAELHKRLEAVDSFFNPKEKPEEILIKMLIQKMVANGTLPNTDDVVPQETQNKIKESEQKNLNSFDTQRILTDEEIESLIQKNITYVKKAKDYDDDTVISTIKKYEKNLSEVSLLRLLHRIREINANQN